MTAPAPLFGYLANHDLSGWSHLVSVVTWEGVATDEVDFQRKPDALKWLKARGATPAQLASASRLMKSREGARFIRPDGSMSDREA